MTKLVHHDLEVTSIAQTCRVLAYRGGSEAVVVDPGGNCPRIERLLEEQKLTPKAIWLTHSHLDHCGAVAALKRRYDIPLCAHAAEAQFRAHVVEIADMYGLPAGDMENCPEPEVQLRGGERLALGPLSFEVLYTPGHSPGHLCFYEPAEKVLLAGDLIFAGSIGRADLPGGDGEELLRSIREKVLTLPADTVIMCGHGPDTSVGVEAKTNPFLTECL